MNRRSLLKSVSILSAATLMPRSIFAESIPGYKFVDNANSKTGPCIIFRGLWAFWISDSGILALTPHVREHTIQVRAIESGKGVKLDDKRYSIDIASGAKSSSTAVAKLKASELTKNAHDGKLSVVLPTTQPYRNDKKKRTFSIRNGADYVSIQLPLPVSMWPLNYVKVDQPLGAFTGNDVDIIRGADDAPITGFPTMRVLVYAGRSATLKALGGKARAILAGHGMENLHLTTVPPSPDAIGHTKESFASLVALFEETLEGEGASRTTQPLNLELGPSFPDNPTTTLGSLPPGVESDEVILVSKVDTPFVNCDAGTLFIGGDVSALTAQ